MSLTTLCIEGWGLGAGVPQPLHLNQACILMRGQNSCIILYYLEFDFPIDPITLLGISSPGYFDVFQNSTSPTITQQSDYEDMLDTIKSFFRERLHFAKSKGILKKQIVLDPGMGFFISGATKYSFVVIRRISELHEFDLPLLLGTSRKYFLAGVSKGAS